MSERNDWTPEERERLKALGRALQDPARCAERERKRRAEINEVRYTDIGGMVTIYLGSIDATVRIAVRPLRAKLGQITLRPDEALRLTDRVRRMLDLFDLMEAAQTGQRAVDWWEEAVPGRLSPLRKPSTDAHWLDQELYRLYAGLRNRMLNIGNLVFTDPETLELLGEARQQARVALHELSRDIAPAVEFPDSTWDGI